MKSTPMNPKITDRAVYRFDAASLPLGRLATQIADLLRGKNLPYFTPHVDCGARVIVFNAKNLKLTGRKLEQKIYYRHSGYRGHLKEEAAGHLLARKPEEIIKHAVAGMLPKNRLQKEWLKRLQIKSGNEGE